MMPANRLNHLEPSPIRMLSEGAPPDSIALGLGEPTWGMPAAGREVLASFAGNCPYGPNAGSDELRQAIADFYSVSFDQTLVTCGSEGALFSLITAWVNEGDEVLVPDPGFPSYTCLSHMCSAIPVTYALDTSNRFRFSLDNALEALERSPRARAMIINHPSNPTGGGIDGSSLQRLAQECASRDVLLISDEVYRDLYFGERPPSLVDVSDEGVVISSVSKGWGCPGLRVGWVVGNSRWLTPARVVHGYAVTGAGFVDQKAATAMMRDSNRILADARQQISTRWAAVERSYPGAEAPDGSFYFWIPLPESAWEDPLAYCVRLRDEARVVLVPGVIFGEKGRRHARLSFAASPDELTEGIRRILAFFALELSATGPR